ncbi:MAG: membrane fusion protein (multidrug efflux system), partial [Francisellaceae bacterium]
MSEKIDGDNRVNQVKPASKKRMLISLGVISGGLVIVFGGLFGFKYMVDKKGEAIMSKWVMAPATVTATKARTIDWNPYIESVGETQSINGVNVTAQVAGVVTKIDFKSGQMVTKGDKIFEIQHDTQNAQLEQDKAAMAIAEITYLRDQKLYEGNAASAQTRDTSLAEYQEAKATVANDQAEVD